MAELSTCFVVLFIGTLYLTGVSRQSALISYTAYKNGKCYFRGREYTPGFNVNGGQGCMQLNCVKKNDTYGFLRVVWCGKVVTEPPCKLTPMTKGTYPKCCPREVCP
uniref:8.9 kDa family member n=1 Tax=Rhipicephalus appendiculatus TaxID=34631 RepID=A0A131Z5X1_RHIAP